MSVVAMIGTLVVGGVLVAAGLTKLVRPEPAARALATVGRRGLAGRPALLGRIAVLRALGLLELCVGLGVLAGGGGPLLAVAAVLLWMFAAWLWLGVARGRSGEPCPCFGAQRAIGVRSASGTLALALLATGLLGTGADARADAGALSRMPATGWLALACGVLACAGLAIAWVAFLLACEVAGLRAQLAGGALRRGALGGGAPRRDALRRGALGGGAPRRGAPRGALEILEEGPALGEASLLIERFAGEEEIALAVFLSPGCAVCGELEPDLALFAVQSATELVVFDEVREQLAWHAAAIPGSPYAVALDRRGVALAKGTFNTLEQLASIPATARSRRRVGLARA